MVDDSKRRAADSLIEAIEDGFTLLEILELAEDDITTSDATHNFLRRAVETYKGESR